VSPTRRAGGPVDQLLGATVEGVGLHQVEFDVAGTREDRLVARLRRRGDFSRGLTVPGQMGEPAEPRRVGNGR